MPTSASQLKVGADVAPPYYIVDGKNVMGFFGDFMAKVVTEAGFELVWMPSSTKRIYRNLAAGQVDVYFGPLQPDLDGFDNTVIHSKLSPFTLELRVYYFGDKPAITKKEDLLDKDIIIESGYTYGGLINYIQDPKNNINHYEVRSFGQAMRMLKMGRYDYHLDYKKTGSLYFEKHNEPDLKHSILQSVNLYFIVSKKTKDAEQILNRLEKALSRLEHTLPALPLTNDKRERER